MRGCTTGRRMFTSAVTANTPCRRPKRPPSSQPLSSIAAKTRVVDQREDLPGEEVEEVADRLRTRPIREQHRAEEEGQVHPRQPQLAARRPVPW